MAMFTTEAAKYLSVVATIIREFNEFSIDDKKLNFQVDEKDLWLQINFTFKKKDVQYTPEIYFERGTPEDIKAEWDEILGRAIKLFNV